MGTREELQSELENILGSENVYYQSPPSTGMKYPAILYTKSNIKPMRANNVIYCMHTQYTLTVIAKRPDHPVIKELLKLPYCSYDRPYKTDNLYHDVLTLYY